MCAPLDLMTRPLSASLALILFAFASRSLAQTPWPVPPEMASTHFTVALNGVSTPVMHAAENIDFLNFPAAKKLKVTVTSDRPDLWAAGVEIEPWRLGIRPVRTGSTLSFILDGPAKITITQPNDMLAEAPTLFLFANPPEDEALKAAPNLRVFGPGAHHENIDTASGDNIYLAPGAVVFGGLNLWQVEHVHVFGRGVIVYDGPQNPASDDGWMHKRNWHCIVMDEAHDISIEGITCVVRSRTWQIQMKDSHNILFDNLKVIGANEGNANADGMDWLGGGDTVVRNSFFLAADDVFAMQNSWEGYGPVAFAVDGNPNNNVTVENTEVSTSISNIVRAAWPEKNFAGGNFHMRNSDVLHMGMGGCGIPFALMEIWADPNGRGRSSDYSFDNIRLEHWGALTLLMQTKKPGSDDGVSNVRFNNISGLELPSLVPSVLKGSVTDVHFANINLAGNSATSDAALRVTVLSGAAEPSYASPQPTLRIVTPAGLIRPGQKIHLVATPAPPHTRYEWTFGDGTHASGPHPKHRFPDTAGTLLDASGRFRVMLHATNPSGLDAWTSAPVIVADALVLGAPSFVPSSLEKGGVNSSTTPSPEPPAAPGLRYTYTDAASTSSGTTPTVAPEPLRKLPENYALQFDGFLEIPADGGYTLTLIANDTSSFTLDGRTYTTPAAFPQVCGLAGNAPRTVTVPLALAKGPHTLRINDTHTTGEDNLRLLWQPPGQPVSEVPATAFSH